tara:strand:- start:5491 stop:5844 length:354 start_codon:yes stop_codon:yes gene_type:complete
MEVGLMVAVLALALVALGVAAVKFPAIRGKLAAAGGAIAAVLAAIVAMAVAQKERDRASKVFSSTKEIKSGRTAAKEDRKETEKSLEVEVAAEKAIHSEASGEQESLKMRKRERLKS